jgi:hypothetical protein
MNAGELRAELDDYGDHVEVVIETPAGDLRMVSGVRPGTRSGGEAVAVIEEAG